MAWCQLFLVIERLFLLKVYERTGRVISVPLTFIVIITGWVLFRNEDLSFATNIIRQMYSFNFFDGRFAMNNDFIVMALLGALISFIALVPAGKRLQEKLYGENAVPQAAWLFVTGGIVLFYISLTYVSALDFNPFIYFRF